MYIGINIYLQQKISFINVAIVFLSIYIKHTLYIAIRYIRYACISTHEKAA